LRKLAEGGAVPRAGVDDLERKVTSFDAQIRATEAEVGAANAEVESLATGLGNLTIASPIDGTVMSKPAAIGDVTNPAMPLAELADFASMLVEVDVPEARLGQVKLQAPCEVVLDALASSRLRGEVVEVAPRLNRAKATGTVKVRLLEPPAELRPEMSARVSFLAKALDAAELAAPPKIVVPSSAVVDRAGGKAVWVVDGGKVRLETVVLGEAFGAGFLLVKGPAPGTRLVKNPPADLRDGGAVQEKSS
jgi:RND family efflux transporter MFP subunit